jgi:two-component system, NtrC family, sensor kinase
MRAFTDLSIKAKLSVSTLVAGGTAMLLASSVLIYNDAHLIRISKAEQLTAVGEMLGANSAAALTFDDAKAANELLASVRSQPTIHFACIYNAKGRVFARYQGEKGDPDFSPPSPAPTGFEFTAGDFLDVAQDIVDRDGEHIGTVYLHSSMVDLNDQLARNVVTVAIVMTAAIGLVFLFSSRLQRSVSQPILELARVAQMISVSRDYSTRVSKVASDELGTLYDAFNTMLDQIQQGERELQQTHEQLEIRVQERTRELSYANLQLSSEIGERKRAEQELEAVHDQLVDAARRAGMAEVATGVLHNVGNVLNSVNVSATLVADRLRRSKVTELGRAVELLNDNAANLASFLTQSDKGNQLREFLRLVTAHLTQEQNLLLEEMQSLTKNVDHVKTIIAMQQSYARTGGVMEKVDIASLVDDALKLNASSFEKHKIELSREYADNPRAELDKQKVLQILVNLVRNARDALVESDRKNRQLTVRVGIEPGKSESEEGRIAITVMDNGVGIAQEDLKRVFSHGFTTKREGHGFGLHSSANAAKELGGTLTAASDGPNCGAVFTLRLPLRPLEPGR